MGLKHFINKYVSSGPHMHPLPPIFVSVVVAGLCACGNKPVPRPGVSTRGEKTGSRHPDEPVPIRLLRPEKPYCARWAGVKPVPTSVVRGKPVAQARGKTGVVQVTEYADRRQLVINRVVQADLPKNYKAPIPDPMVQLIKASRPNAETALVVGLGSGNTARALAASGLHVSAVEIEPKVIKYARRYFNYKGHAACADGIDYLRRSWRVYDIIVMDAFVGARTPAHLFKKKALRIIDERLALGGVLAIRLLDSPASKRVSKLVEELMKDPNPDDDEQPFKVKTFGSGAVDEVQNLYILASKDHLDMVAPRGIPVWPVLVPPVVHPDEEFNPEQEDIAKKTSYLHRYHQPCGTAPRGFRHVLLVGYLVMVGKNRTLCLDLPYREMGALRVVLKGNAVGRLRRLVSSIPVFPTSGGRRTDGDTSRTMKGLLGGETYLGTDTRFSPVALAVEGDMVLTASQRFYAKWRRRAHAPFFSKTPYETLLPFGGHLYELTITRVHWSLSYRQWKRFNKIKLEPQLLKAANLIRRGRIRAFHNSFADYVALFRSRFGVVAARFPDYAEARTLLVEWAKHIKSVPKRARPATVAKVCERMAEGVEAVPAVIEEALQRCAGLGGKHPTARRPRSR